MFKQYQIWTQNDKGRWQLRQPVKAKDRFEAAEKGSKANGGAKLVRVRTVGATTAKVFTVSCGMMGH